jgi:magnesium transporter
MSVWYLYSRRIVWLSLLVILNLITANIIENYEHILAATVALSFFIPLLLASGGNSGSQAATLMVRAISTGDIKLNEWLKVIFKECAIGFSLGIIMGSLTSLLGFYWGGLNVGLIMAISMLIIIIVSNLIGTILPFLLTLFKFDPAIASGPLVTTITDISGILIYFFVSSNIIIL